MNVLAGPQQQLHRDAEVVQRELVLLQSSQEVQGPLVQDHIRKGTGPLNTVTLKFSEMLLCFFYPFLLPTSHAASLQTWCGPVPGSCSQSRLGTPLRGHQGSPVAAKNRPASRGSEWLGLNGEGNGRKIGVGVTMSKLLS